jgi:hypothetical protein
MIHLWARPEAPIDVVRLPAGGWQWLIEAAVLERVQRFGNVFGHAGSMRRIDQLTVGKNLTLEELIRDDVTWD